MPVEQKLSGINAQAAKVLELARVLGEATSHEGARQAEKEGKAAGFYRVDYTRVEPAFKELYNKLKRLVDQPLLHTLAKGDIITPLQVRELLNRIKQMDLQQSLDTDGGYRLVTDGAKRDLVDDWPAIAKVDNELLIMEAERLQVNGKMQEKMADAMVPVKNVVELAMTLNKALAEFTTNIELWASDNHRGLVREGNPPAGRG